ncbi:hypothetical protein [Streptomyces sp. R08]|uniref:Uncharacterized protein n=1 Tax=Streptomyces sp. R08 TaxID=3238624 RepID=A0AB39MP57_9ACTN
MTDHTTGTDRPQFTATEALASTTGMKAVPLPVRPRLCPGLMVLPDRSGIIIEGGPARRHLTGVAARELLPRMLPLLDGTRTTAALAGELGITVAQATQAVATLNLCQLVEEGAEGAGPDSDDPTSVFLSRTVGLHRVHRSGAAAAAAIRAAAVVVVAPGPAGTETAADLEALGLGAVLVRATAAEVGDTDLALLRAAPRALVMALEKPASVEAMAELEGRCREAGVPLLRCAATAAAVEVGPLFHHAFTACYRCFVAAADPASADAANGPVPFGLALALGVDELLGLLTGNATSQAYRTLNVLTLPDLSRSRRLLTPAPDCPSCKDLPSAGQKSADAAYAFEQQVEHKPVELVLPGHDAWQFQVGIKQLQVQRPNFGHHPFLDFPPTTDMTPYAPGAGYERQRAADGSTGVSPQVAAYLLSRVGGRQDRMTSAGTYQRWAASAGNLGSVTPYLLTRPSWIPGLPGTVFRYDDVRHGLIAVSAQEQPLADLLSGTDLDERELTCCVVLVAALSRVQAKYQRFAFRLVHLDAGVATAQLAYLADDLGVDLSLASRWDSGLEHSLELSPGREVVTAVTGLR